MGLEPGNKGDWIQSVPAVSTELNGQDSLTLNVAEGGATKASPSARTWSQARFGRRPMST